MVTMDFRVLLQILAVITLAASHKLEMGKCSTAKNYEGKVNIKGNHMLKKERLRTNIECAIFCYNLNECKASAYETYNTGVCYLMSYIPILNMSAPFTTAMVTDLLQTNGKNVCRNVDCPDNSTCKTECDPEVGPKAVCVEEMEDCDIHEEYLNIRHYYSFRHGDGSDDGTVFTLTYPKLRDDTLLRVIWHATMRGHYEAAYQCTRWYFTFNNVECSAPLTIDFLCYSDRTGNMHRAGDMDGSCGDIAKGAVKVDVRIGACPNYSVVDGYTGWNNNRQLLVMEIIPHQPNTMKPCSGLTTFNYQYMTNTNYFDQVGQNQAVQSMYYTKIAPDTALRIKYNANTRIYFALDDKYYCGRWWLRIAGSDCRPEGDYVLNGDHGSYNYHRNSHRHKTLEAFCENVPAATVKIEVVTGQCHYQKEPTDLASGWNSPSRLMVEEVRLGKSTEAALHSSVGRTIKNPFFNVVRMYYWLIDSETDEGLIKEFSYVKQSPHSALRLTSSGDHRTTYGNGWGQCSRWYFKIEDAECTDPGNIEALSNFNYDTNLHHPLQVSGICRNIPAGTLKISYFIGKCHGYGNTADGYTGWGSSFHLIAEEVHLESTTICASGNPVNCNV